MSQKLYKAVIIESLWEQIVVTENGLCKGSSAAVKLFQHTCLLFTLFFN